MDTGGRIYLPPLSCGTQDGLLNNSRGFLYVVIFSKYFNIIDCNLFLMHYIMCVARK